MPKLHRLAALVAASVALGCAAPALAAPVTVNLRVEGTSGTIYEGPVTTDGHDINGHPCDGGSGNGTSNQPGPTQTAALDDASHIGGFSWSGTWDEYNSGYLDFFIHRIGPDSDSSSTFWYLVRNWTGLQQGGCQQQVQAGDDLLFALTGYDPVTYATWPLLELSGTPARAAVGEQFTAHVVQHDGNGSPSTPASGAAVGGATTGADGNAVVSFDSSGTKMLKASRDQSIRSNAQSVCVYTPGSGECGTEKAGQTQTSPAQTNQPPGVSGKDTIAPVVRVTSLTAGKVYRRGPRMLQGDVDESGGIAQVFLRLREVDHHSAGRAAKGLCRWFSGKREVFSHRSVACARARFFRIGTDAHWSYLLPNRLANGSYVLDVKVLDKSYNAGRMSVPFAVR